MLIPAIDLLGGRVVQLKQGKELIFASDDLDTWLERFRLFPVIQVIDLDAAMRQGDNAAIVRRLCRERRCQVGGGIRTPEHARAWLADGASRVIIGSALFNRDGVNVEQARAFSNAAGADALIAAIDSRNGYVVTHGWKTSTTVTAAQAIQHLDPFVGAFLYTHVDTEGTLSGLDPSPILALKPLTSRRLIAAGGIRTIEEVRALDRLGVDAVVGMAIYTEVMSPTSRL